MRLIALFPNLCSGKWLSHICVSLCEAASTVLPTRMFAHTLYGGFRSNVVAPAVPAWSTSLAYRIDRVRPFLDRRTTKRFLDALVPGDICWIWPGASPQLLKQIRQRGNAIVVEAINCHQATAKRILDREYEQLGWETRSSISAEQIQRENDLYELADFIFSPSPLVSRSLKEDGVLESKILRTSYGWSPQRINSKATHRTVGRKFTCVSTGSVCIRKGSHVLVQAWKAAGVDGKLLLAGNVASEFLGRQAEHLGGDGIELLGHVKDVSALMDTADTFVFPTREEGGPLVTYEAAAKGLAVLTTPMGAGEIVCDQVEGIVLDPNDLGAWIFWLRKLAVDQDLRKSLGSAALKRAQHFTWDQVARRRVDSLVRVTANVSVGNAGSPSLPPFSLETAHHYV